MVQLFIKDVLKSDEGPVGEIVDLSIISSQISSPNTLPAGSLFPISVITLPNSAYFNLLL